MMAESFEDSRDIKFIIERFEKMLLNNESHFFNLDTYLEIIHYYKLKKSLKKAIKACEYAQEQHPFSAETYLEFAEILLLQGNYEKAFQKASKAQEFSPNDIDSLLVQANIYFLSESYGKSIEVLKKVHSLQPEDAETNFRLGFLYQEMGNFYKASYYYLETLEQEKNNIDAARELAWCLKDTGDWGQGITFFENKIDIDPYDEFAWFGLGLLYLQKKDFEKAVRAFDYAVIIQNNFAEGYEEMGNAHMNQQEYQEAQEAYLKAKDLYLEVSPNLLCCIGVSYEKQNDYRQAVGFYRKAMQLENQWADAWFGIGCCLVKQEKWYESLHFFKKAVYLEENNERYWLALAAAEQEIGNFYTSIEAYEKVASISGNIPELWLNWSYAYFEQGKEQDAISIIEEGIEELPEEAILYYYAAAYLIEAGRYKEGFNFLQNALLLNFEQHKVLYDFFPDLQRQKAIFKIIEQYRT